MSRAALLQMVGVEKQALTIQHVPRQFVEDFETVATHYKLKELGEYDQAKQAARENIESATITFAALANKIREGN